jgi:type IV pilus assembly protein PilM
MGGINLVKNYLSIDFGAQNIKMAVGSLNNNVFLIDKLDSIDTPKGSYLDGRILDEEKLAKALRNQITKLAMKSKDVAITFNSTNIITREIILPVTNDKEMDSMILYEIKQQLPIEMDQYVVEYRLVDEFLEDSVKKNRIFVAAVPKIMVESFFGLIKNLNLNPVSMNINTNALSRLITEKASINNDTNINNDLIAVLDFGNRSINISILSKGNLAFSRTINQGSNDLDIAIATDFKVDLEEADKIKHEFNLMNAKENANGEYQAAAGVISRWIQEIKRVLQFYESRGNTKISKLYIYGGASGLKGLPQYMRESINLPVEPIVAVNSIKQHNSQEAAIDIRNYLNAIGAIPRTGRWKK